MTRPAPSREIAFALLSAADFALTWWLIDRPDGGTYEANPVARFWLARFGWLGLAGYKAACVCAVLGLAAVIARSRPRASAGVLRLGCACLAAVVVYSAFLALTAGTRDRALAARAADEEAEINRQIASDRESKAPFRALLVALSDAVAAEPRALREVAERLREEAGGRRDMQAVLRVHYDDRPEGERYACWLICHAVTAKAARPAEARRLARRLYGEYHSAYGAPPPERLTQLLGENGPRERAGGGGGAGLE